MSAVTLCAVVLAAGEGRRLRPLTAARPKALCPVGNVALLDRALGRVGGLGLAGPAVVAVNAAYLGGQIVTHVGDRATLSVEPAGPMGTAGGVALLRDWIGGRGVLVANADAYLADPDTGPGADIAALVAGWDGDSVRLLGRRLAPGESGGFGGYAFAGCSVLPWRYVRDLPTERMELVQAVWRPAEAAGRLDVIEFPGTYLDTGTPASYLAANLHAAAGGSLVAAGAEVTGEVHGSVVGAGAVVAGMVTRSVVWPGGHVPAGEHLVDAIRFDRHRTVAAPDIGQPRR